ncbi:hypothetical protein [Nocardioides sp. Root151]|uniref:hypothetical protein n=1 Tax=Nocardioides sp. Root151 TaxID=1736475 RepID=UPI0007025E0D|nr:hypothetical protein [Nocardioides sp. Root151]KQZ75302.1 hypothetical protein ASD66_02760 [Nocardioides sp. Root151]
MNEHEMTALLERATQGVHGTEALVAGGVRRGQRRVRRQRATALAGAAAVVALVATTAMLGPFGEKAPNPDERVAATDVKPKPAEAGPALPPKLERLQQQVMAPVPARLVADGTYVGTIEFDPRDGTGLGTVQAIVTEDPDDPLLSTWAGRCAQLEGCSETAGGWVLVEPSSPDVLGVNPDLEGARGFYLGRDGRSVDLVAYNGTDPQMGGPVTREDPVLSRQELVQLVTDPTWFDS